LVWIEERFMSVSIVLAIETRKHFIVLYCKSISNPFGKVQKSRGKRIVSVAF
jgi:hypothetical protein